MSIANSHDLGDLANPNNPFVDWGRIVYDGSDWFTDECRFCGHTLDDGDWCARCEEDGR